MNFNSLSIFFGLNPEKNFLNNHNRYTPGSKGRVVRGDSTGRRRGKSIPSLDVNECQQG